MLSLCLLLCSVCSGALVDLALVIDRVDDNEDGYACKDHSDGRGGDGEEVSALDVHVAHEVLLAHGSQNKGQQDGRKGELVLVHQPADDAEGDTDAHIKGILVDGERAQQGDDEDDGVEHLLLDRDDLCKEADAEATHHQHAEVCQHQSCEDAVDGGCRVQ